MANLHSDNTFLNTAPIHNNWFYTDKQFEIDSWLFMQSPVPVISILAFYLYFVLKLGPQLMEKRKPFEIQRFLVIYNAYQVLFNLWLCVQALNVDVKRLINTECKHIEDYPELTTALHKAAWWYFFSKIIELFDTVFFVLRKKQSQVTFLHVYHHTVTTLFSWGYLKYLPGEQGIVIGFLNSLVHVIMYFYYMVAAMGSKYQKYLWWKKYMTWIQLTQFCIMLVYLVSIIVMDCKVPKSLTFFFVANAIIFLYLFSDFYRKAYKKKSKKIENETNTNGDIISNLNKSAEEEQQAHSDKIK